MVSLGVQDATGPREGQRPPEYVCPTSSTTFFSLFADAGSFLKEVVHVRIWVRF
ncbi:hypothetical protein BH09PLA1_BH09PLA1_10850 [soil metagenome]